MNALTLKQLQIGGEFQEFIDARSLYKFLGSAREFATWVKARIKRGGFVEGKDFLIEVSKSGGRPSTEYNLTPECAIIIASNENTNKGREFIKFFTEKQKEREIQLSEKIVQLQSQNSNLMNILSETNKQFFKLKEDHRLLEARVPLKYKYGLEETAEALGICKHKFCQRLRELNYIEYKYEYKSKVNVPTQKSELLNLITKEKKDVWGIERTQSYITQKGFKYFKSKKEEYFDDIKNRINQPLQGYLTITNLTKQSKGKEQLLI